uniref:Uncharacterized protein n=1 Tax=Acrobeloides nanus TaxID=290746 RepID=A0A914DAS1_9BILA
MRSPRQWRSTSAVAFASGGGVRRIRQYQHAIKEWIRKDCPLRKGGTFTIFKRPSAVEYPNTFVLIWTEPNILAGPHTDCFSKISLNVHYEGQKLEEGKPLKVLGSLWAKGFDGSLKPQQEFDKCLKDILIQKIGSTSPDPSHYEKYGHVCANASGVATMNIYGAMNAAGAMNASEAMNEAGSNN